MNPVVFALSKYRFHHQTEEELHIAICQILVKEGIAAEREVKLGPRDRIDFMAGSIGIEVKIKGSAASALRQLYRYARYPQVEELVLVTSRIQAGRMPADLLGKPVSVVFLMGGLA